jgi:hypothetical protein
VYPCTQPKEVEQYFEDDTDHVSNASIGPFPVCFTPVVELLAIINQPEYSILMNASLLCGFSLIQQSTGRLNLTFDE